MIAKPQVRALLMREETVFRRHVGVEEYIKSDIHQRRIDMYQTQIQATGPNYPDS